MDLFVNLEDSAEYNAVDRCLAYEFSEGSLRVPERLLPGKFM